MPLTNRSRLRVLQLLSPMSFPSNRYVFFWDHIPSAHNPVHIAIFSQWYPSPFTDPSYPDATFQTAEHYMMYRKAMLFHPDSADAILKAPSPAEAKRLGRTIPNFDRDKWNAVADDVVERGNWLKFGQREDRQNLVINTGSRILVEASPEDRIWGIGFGADEAEGKEAEWGLNR